MANETVNEVDKIKKELFEMQDRRKKIEDEIVMHRVTLQNNKVGMTELVVDREGFPRNDIDVYAVRHARNNIIRLENDAKDLINIMKEKLEQLHSLND